MKGSKSPKKSASKSIGKMGRKSTSKRVAKKGPIPKSSTFSKRDDSMQSSEDDSDDSDTSIENFNSAPRARYSDTDSSDSSDSSSDSSNDDDLYLNKIDNESALSNNKKYNRRQSFNRKGSMALLSSDDDDNYSSSSEEEDVDYVQLTKQRRMKAMKAVKGYQTKDNSNKIEAESAEEGEVFENTDSELDDDLVDAVIKKEEKKLDDLDGRNDFSSQVDDYDDDLAGLNFDFDFNEEEEEEEDNDDDNNSIFNNSRSQTPKACEEDVGEIVDDISIRHHSAANEDIHVQMKVPKFEEKDINSDDDYSIDKDELIQTLMVDNDESELHVEGDESEEDVFDKLAATRKQYTPGSEKDIMTTPDDDISDADSDKLMALETKAMVDDYYESQTKKLLRRGSIYRAGAAIDNDLELDRLDNFEDMFPKQQAFRRRSSILDQSLLSSSDEDGLSKFRSNLRRKKSKKSSKKADIIKMLGTVEEVYSDAIDSDSCDDTNLVLNILTRGDSDDNDTSSLNDGYKFDVSLISDDETDEDISLPKMSTKKHLGSKHAKEVLSSSSLGFGAPPLGTFTTKKPFSVIDGISTRFVQPFESPRKAKLEKMKQNAQSTDQNDPLALDELLNIEEFEEDRDDDPFNDPAHDHETNDKLQEMFGEKHIPLTAFRNKGLVNKYHLNGVEALNSSKYSYAEKKAKRKVNKRVKIKEKNPIEEENPIKEVDNNNELKVTSLAAKAPAGPVPIHSTKGVIVKKDPIDGYREPSLKARGISPSVPNIDDYVISNQDDINGFAAFASDDENDTFGAIMDEIPELDGVDEVLLIGMDPLLNSELVNEELHPRKRSRRSSRLSFSTKSFNKNRLRRASMAEAQKEGLRATKGGVFDEEMMEDVEAFLVDVGGADEFGYLLGTE